MVVHVQCYSMTLGAGEQGFANLACLKAAFCMHTEHQQAVRQVSEADFETYCTETSASWAPIQV